MEEVEGKAFSWSAHNTDHSWHLPGKPRFSSFRLSF
jgi:hypothetical protein